MRIRNSFSLLGITFFWMFLTVQNSYSQCLNVDIEVIVDQLANPCNGPITLDAHYPGYNFLWNTGETTGKILVTKSDTYIVTVDDGMGCIGKDTLQVTFMDKPSVNLGPDPASQCGGCVTLDPGSDPGLTYVWSTGQTTNQISYCKPGIHDVWVRVTNSLGCYATDTVRVEITPGIDVDLGSDIKTCGPASVTLAPDISGSSYLWSTGETTSSIQVSTSGDYSVIVSDGTCSGVDTIHVQFNSAPVVDLGPDLATQCGGCVTLEADASPKPGYTYVWSNGATGNKINICKPGTYTISVKVTSEVGCEARDTINFQLTPGLSVNLGPDVSVCKSEYLIQSNVTGSSILWNTGETTPNILVTTSGTYYVDITNGSCKGVDSIKVNLFSSPDIDLGPDPAPKCGGCATISVPFDPSLEYIWSTGETGNSIKYCKPGISEIILTAFNSAGCKDSDTLRLNIEEKFNFSINQGMDTVVCKGPISLNATLISGASYYWNTGDQTNSISVNSSGDYYVFVFNLPGCDSKDTLSDTISVTFRNPFPAPDSITELSDCNKYQYKASPVDGATFYAWTVPAGVTIMSGQGTQNIVVSSAGNVTGILSVKASNSSPTCAGDGTELEIELGERKVSIPNAFTPNGDGINDTWVMRNIQYYPNNSLVVLNRWGNEVYKKNNYANQWNGSSLNEGSYFYKLIINACGQVKELTGYVTIVR